MRYYAVLQNYQFRGIFTESFIWREANDRLFLEPDCHVIPLEGTQADVDDIDFFGDLVEYVFDDDVHEEWIDLAEEILQELIGEEYPLAQLSVCGEISPHITVEDNLEWLTIYLYNHHLIYNEIFNPSEE